MRHLYQVRVVIALAILFPVVAAVFALVRSS